MAIKDDLLQKALEEIMAYYQTQGMGARVGFGKRPAVIVVDFMKGLTDAKRPAGCNMDAEVDNTAALLKKARQKDIPIFFFIVGYNNTSLEGGLFVKKLPTVGSWKIGSDDMVLDPRLNPQPQEAVFIKKYASCFFGTPLASSLTALRVDTVIITGCSTSGCIRATATDSMQLGFHTIIPRECVGDRNRIPHEVNLMDINARYADVVPLREVIAYLNETV